MTTPPHTGQRGTPSPRTMEAAVLAIARAEVLIIGGTSLTVYPAAGLVRYYRGNKLVVINRTALDGAGADLTITEPIGSVMAQL